MHVREFQGRTVRFTATMGVAAGYDNPTDAAPPAPDDTHGLYLAGVRKGIELDQLGTEVGEIAVLWSHYARVVDGLYGCEPSAVIAVADVAYPHRFGCPVGGEPVFTLTGNFNPHWGHGTETTWRQAVLAVTERLAEHYDQVTFQVTFDEVDLHYFRQPADAPDTRRG
jgi:hypothetical protein